MAFATYIELTETVGEKRFINQTKNELKADVKNKNAQIKALNEQLKTVNKENKLLTKKTEEIEKLKKEINDKEEKALSLKKENDKIRASWSFRIGKLIVWLPGKIKRIFKK